MRTLFQNRMLATAIAAAFIGFASSALEARAATYAAVAKCGDDTMCYSVPDGCGVGVGCNTATCEDEICPSVMGGEDVCKFCSDPE